jgi:CrcB protein
VISAIVAVASGGALGALARFGTVYLSQILLGTRFPLGTLLVNCIGSFLIGFLMNFLMDRLAGSAEIWRLFLIVGFLGAYTTFSSFAWETVILYSDKAWMSALVNILLNNIGTLAMVLLGIQSARIIEGVA